MKWSTARILAWAGGVGLGLGLLLSSRPALAFIERPLPLDQALKDSDHIFVAKVESVDPAKPAAILTVDQDLKGKAPYRRLPINLMGDKEKHTPQLLKRIAPELPLVVFVTFLDNKHWLLGYTNGTWFQVIGHPDGDKIRWGFTHCEIYLRRTFKGTTREMQETVADVLAGKRKPPPYNPKEPPGFGPELEPQRPKGPQAQAANGSGAVLFGVIALPFLMPVAALLQLLFPGLLRDQWRQYRIAVSILLTQSTLLFLHWALLRWVVTERQRWLGDDVLWGALVLVAGIGAVGACLQRAARLRQGDLPGSAAPLRVEYVALGTLFLAGLGWVLYLVWTNSAPFDQMAVVALAAAAGVLHLVYRRARTRATPARPLVVSTELVFLWALVLAGAGLGLYLLQPAGANEEAGAVAAAWPTFRGSVERRGSVDPNDPGIRQPTILWTFDPAEQRGRVMIHSSPTVVDQQVYVGVLHQVQTLALGYLYCLNAQDGRQLHERTVRAGTRLWRFTADRTLKPVFSSPTIAGGKLYFGEGYHQDAGCRLFCLDARQGNTALWAKPTTSHVESTPTVVGQRVYFGAGDDGIYCVDAGELETVLNDVPRPKTIWQVKGLHVDAPPLVVGDLLFAGSIVGPDVQWREMCVLAVDARTGQERWRMPTALSAMTAPAWAEGRVFFGLGNGKIDHDADRPAGAVLALDAQTGRRLWEFPTGSAVFGTPVTSGGHVIFCSRDQHCYCVRQIDGQLVWKTSLEGPVAASPVVAGGKVYVVTTSGLLFALEATRGTVLWRFAELQAADEGAGECSSPTLANGRLYLAVGGKVHCIGDKE